MVDAFVTLVLVQIALLVGVLIGINYERDRTDPPPPHGGG